MPFDRMRDRGLTNGAMEFHVGRLLARNDMVELRRAVASVAFTNGGHPVLDHPGGRRFGFGWVDPGSKFGVAAIASVDLGSNEGHDTRKRFEPTAQGYGSLFRSMIGMFG